MPQGLLSGHLRGKIAVVLPVQRHGVFAALLEHRARDAAAGVVPAGRSFVSASLRKEPEVPGGPESLYVAVLARKESVFPKVQRMERILPVSPVSAKP